MADGASSNRGQPAQPVNGAARGSGAGAGGDGGPEEYDTDAQGGGGSLDQDTGAKPAEGGDGPKGGSR